MDFFADDDHYFGANEYAISGEAQDENCNGLYQGDLFSSIKSPPEYVSLKQNRQYGHQSPRKYSNACYGYSSHPFPVRHETTSYQKTSVDPSADPFERSHKAAPIGDCIPRNMPTLEPPCSVMSQHKDSNLFPDEFPANLLSEMFELQDFSETDPQFGELMEKKDIVQRKQEKNRKKSQLLLKQPGRSCGDMNSRDFIERYKINCPSGSKDRHSKIVTSRGPRDRRIRLSVETAIKFFDVQDRLGFDQPGKAIEWLIEKSCSAIEQLRAMPPSPPDISSGQHTCSDSSLSFLHRDTQSTRADFITNYEENLGGAYSLSANLSTEPDVVQQHFCSRHKRNNPRKTGLKAAEFKTARRCIHEESLKENRSKARERARERTKEKVHTSESAASASSHMNYTKTVEIETFNLQETIASTSPETIVKETLVDASGKHLSCHSPTLKFGLLENPLTGYFHHRGNCIKAQDNSVEEFAGNLHMISDSNMSFSYSQSQIQSLVQYVAQPEDRNMQSTGSFSGLCSTTVPFSSCMFPEAVTPINGDMRIDYSLLLSPSIRSSAQPFMSL